MIVIDASAALEILGHTEIGLLLQEQIDGMEWHAPHLIDLEVANALRGLVTGRVMKAEEAQRTMAGFLSLPILRHPHFDLLDRVWALRHNLTAYDAAYLALAEKLAAQLVTMDDGLRRAANRSFH